jgi:MtN3 and saliva related transmembrane protein
MHLITLLGFVAGTLTTLSFLPQVHKAWRTKRCDDLSMGMLLSFGAGVSLWTVYGLLLHARPVIVANVVTLALLVALVYLKARYQSQAGS